MFQTLAALTLGVLIILLIVAVIITQLAIFYGTTIAASATVGLIVFAAWAWKQATA